MPFFGRDASPKYGRTGLRLASQTVVGAAAMAGQVGPYAQPAINISGYQKTYEQTRADAAKLADEAKKKSIDWATALQQVTNTLQVLGVTADSSLGRFVGGITAALAGVQGVGKALDAFGSQLTAIKAKQAPGGGGASLGDFAQLGSSAISGIMNGITAFKGATNFQSGIMRALGGAAVGAQIGSQIGGMIPGPMGKAIGAGAGAVIGAVVGIFHKPAWASAADAVGKEFGLKVSQQLAQTIADTSKTLGVSMQSATLLNLDKIMGESNKDARTFSKQTIDLMNGVKLGSIPAQQGIDQIGKSFTAMADAANKAGAIGDSSLRQLIQRSKELGQDIPAIKNYLKEQLTNAAGGVGALIASFTAETKGSDAHFLSGIQASTAEQGKAQAEIFSSVFFATLKEQGPVAAADAMRDTFSRMKENLTTIGSDPHAFDAILAPIQRLMDLTAPGSDKGDAGLFRGAIEGAQGLVQALTGVANAGYLTQQSFDAFENQAQAAFQQAQAGGATQQEALQAMGPLLQALVNAQEHYGVNLDQTTQDLIKQAREAGVAFPVDPIDRAADALERIANIFDRIAGSSGQTAENVKNFANGANSANGRSIPYVPSGPPGEGYAEGSGGIVDFGKGTPTVLHGREIVMTEKQAKAAMAGRSHVYAPNVNINIGPGASAMKDEVYDHVRDIVDGNYRDFVRTLDRRLNGRR